MIDIVYPIGKGSRWQNNEIRYSLRSVQKHLKNVGNIWIIGELPQFLQNVNFIHHRDTATVPEENVRIKLLKACDKSEISDRFLFMNDDHFILADADAENYPYYFCSTIREAIKVRGMDNHGVRFQNTLSRLEAKTLPIKNFELHYPIIFEKQAFKDTLGYLEPKHLGYKLRSLYANTLNIQGKEVKDCKSREAPLEKAICFSTLPIIAQGVQDWLKKIFPNRSIYEL